MKNLLKRYLDEFHNLCLLDFHKGLSDGETREFNFFLNMFESLLGLNASLGGTSVPHLRIPVSMPVEFTDYDPPMTAPAVDISPRGLFVATDHQFVLGQVVSMKAYPENSEEPMELDGKIVRVVQSGEGDSDRPAGVAIEISTSHKNEVLCDFFFKLLKNAIQQL